MRSLKCCVSPHEECRWVQLRRYVAQVRGPRAARRGCLVSRLQLSARLYRQHVPGEQVRSAVARAPGCSTWLPGEQAAVVSSAVQAARAR